MLRREAEVLEGECRDGLCSSRLHSRAALDHELSVGQERKTYLEMIFRVHVCRFAIEWINMIGDPTRRRKPWYEHA